MRFAPRGRTLGEALTGGLILLLLLVCCVLLVGSGPMGILLSCVGLCLTGLAWVYTKVISGEFPEVETPFSKRVSKPPVRSESGIKRDASAWGCSEEVAMKLHHLEKHVNELVVCNVLGRLADLERQDERRTRVEWSELRDVWRKLVRDPATDEKLRQACLEWLAKYPETLDYLPKKLKEMGLLQEKELPDDWEERELRKHRIQ
ncbi:MAG: hypothetical protein EPN47_17600 [Acidobacteria bacterium]|jgi:hypothetical protein|nr:MAG: hypothetical protein EPN47_17600 [Acidobacteriota bacterium]